jgi:hypothetical protein
LLKAANKVKETTPGSYKIETSEPEIVVKELMELSIQQNVNIITLSTKNDSLEDVFKELTVKQPAQ